MMSWRSKTYDELPALAIRGPGLRRALRVATVAWMYGIVWMTCTTGAPLMQFCQMVGFSQFAFGLLSAIPFIATLGQLVAAVIIDRTGLAKYQFLQCFTVSRLLWLAIAAIPLLLPTPSAPAVAAMLLIYGASYFLAAMGMPASLTWFSAMIPRRIRGRYFARRWLMARPIQIIAVIVLWVVLDWATEHNAAYLPPHLRGRVLWTISAIFAVAAVFGTADILLFKRIREVVRTNDKPFHPSIEFNLPPPVGDGMVRYVAYAISCCRLALRQLLIDPLGDRVFRHYVLYGATLAFAIAVSGPFFYLNALYNLGFSLGITQFLFMIVSPAIGLIGVRQWGKLIDRWGRRPVLIVGSAGTWLSILPWFFARHDTPAPQFVFDAANYLSSHIGALFGSPDFVALPPGTPVGAFLLALLPALFGGIAWTGIMLGQNNVLLGFADGQGRSKYIAASSVLISFGGIAGGLVGGLVAQKLQYLQAVPLEFGIFRWNQWHATFVISLVGRMFALMWLLNMPDPGASRTREMLRYVMTAAYNNLTYIAFTPLRAIGWGRGERPRGDRDA